MDTSNNAKLLIGLKKNINKENLKEAIYNNKNIEDMFNYFDIKKGDCFYIPNGCIHAILGNSVIAEIQTPSDITYRLYDWNRFDNNHKLRELHIEDSFNVIKDMDYNSLKSIRNIKYKDDNLEINILFSNGYLLVEEYIVNNCFSSRTYGNTFEVIVVVDGDGIIKSDLDWNSISLHIGKTVLIPANLGSYIINSYIGIKFLRVSIL